MNRAGIKKHPKSHSKAFLLKDLKKISHIIVYAYSSIVRAVGVSDSNVGRLTNLQNLQICKLANLQNGNNRCSKVSDEDTSICLNTQD